MSHHFSTFFDTEPSKHKPFATAKARPHYTPDRPGQVEHIFLDLRLDFATQRCEGTCYIQLNPIRSGIEHLTLDAVDLTIKEVRIGRSKQSFEHNGQQLRISLKQPTTAGKHLTLSITYVIEHPQRGLYFIQPDANAPRKPIQAWTQGEDEDSRFWFPCFDYPGQLSTSEVRVQVPRPLVAISNGTLIETTTEGSQVTYHWQQKQAHPTYLVTLAVGEFSELTDEWRHPNGGTVAVNYYVEKGREADALRSMGKTPRMIEFFSQRYGYPYPFTKYAQVCVDDFIFGGMENTSATLLTDRCLLDERASLDNRSTETLVAHELAHQWFGDLVAIKHWAHAWIKEGMASYAEVVWVAAEYGAEEAAYYRLQEARRYFAEDSGRYRRPMVTHIYRNAIELYDRHIYEKGSCVYHMIRAELGEDLFWQAIHTFVRDYAHHPVETVDLLRSIEKATGRNLAFLFDQYVYRGGYPEYKVAYSWDADAKLAKLTITQLQLSNSGPEGDHFDLKIAIAFNGVKRNTATVLQSVTLRIHEPEQSFYLPLLEKPSFISFDVDNPILKKVTLDYPLPELKAQLQYDPDPISRIYAAEAIAKKGNLESVQALAAALKEDPFWGVRAEVARLLATVKLNQALTALLLGLKDPEARVRRSTVEAIATCKTPSTYKALKAIVEKGDASYYVEAAALSALGIVAAAPLTDKPKEDKVLKIFKAVLKERAGWNEVVRAGAISGLSHLKSSVAALDLLLAYTTAGTPQPLRLAAIRALGTIANSHLPIQIESILDRLEVLADESFFLTQISVVAALGQIKHANAIALLRRLAQRTPDGRVQRMAEEAIQQVQEAIEADQKLKTMQSELEDLKQANQDLQSRLAALEAKTKPEKAG